MNHAIAETFPTIIDQQTRPFDVLRSVRRAVARWRRKRKAISQLHSLSDRSLADIGLARSDIESVIWSGIADASRQQR